MVCIYCGHDTHVINSRHQKRINQVWRRRHCNNCAAVFTTLESVDTAQAFRIRRTTSLEPFSRDTLLLSVYDSLRHRPTADVDASALTVTILGTLYPLIQDAIIEREVLVSVTGQTLQRFDEAAATHYRAFHPLKAT